MSDRRNLYQRSIRGLQERYEKNRAPELNGTTPVSRDFFDLLINKGPIAAWGYLVTMERYLGDRLLPPPLKAVFQILGSSMLATGLTQQVQKNEVQERSDLSARAARALYTFSTGLLFSAQDDTRVVVVREDRSGGGGGSSTTLRQSSFGRPRWLPVSGVPDHKLSSADRVYRRRSQERAHRYSQVRRRR